MKKTQAFVVSALAAACMAAVASQQVDDVQWLSPLQAEPAAAPAEGPVDETSARWFVELSGAPAAEGGDAAALRAEKRAFRDAARAARMGYVEHFAYDGLFNGLSISVARSQLSTLARLPGVKAIYPVDRYTMPQPQQTDPEMFSALAATGADIAQNELGLDGGGVRVAVIDSGIDIDHPDFGGSGTPGATSFPTARIVAGYDFVGDAFGTTAGEPAPDANPDDCGGHGTHVAGIIGGNGTIRGVAPNVSFGAYRVFGCGGSTSADIIVAAMERAHADGMHVVNMSLGAGFQWPQYPTSQAATRLVNKGVVVVASAGNSGANGIYSSGAPSVGDKVISVASFENSMVTQPAIRISPDNRAVAYGVGTGGTGIVPTSGTAMLARTGTAASTADACSALPAGSLAGRVALIRRGTCAFHIKALNAQNAGATGVVIYNNAAGTITPNVAGTPTVTIPVISVTAADGVLMDSRIAAGPVQMTWGSSVSVPNPSGAGLMSSFSSYGLSPTLTLKPDIGAPGGRIYSTYPLEAGGFASLSGTSMSSPHVAGAVALLLQAAPRTPAQAVGRILQNSAVPQLWSGNPGLGVLDLVHRQGAGMLRIDQAITTATRVEPGKLSLGESEAGPATRTLSLHNSGTSTVTYVLSHANAVASGPGTYAPTFFLPGLGVDFAVPSVTLLPGQSASVQVTITPPVAPAGGIYGGYLVMTPNDGSAVLRVPFAGYVGDYQARQVLTPTSSGFPWLGRLNAAGTSYLNQPAGGTFSMAGNDVPFVLAHFDHQAALFRVEIVDADSGKSWHRALQLEHVGRNSTAQGFFAFSWDGTTTAGKKTYQVPNGRYVMKVSALRALGDASNPAHWETWDSPVVTIAR